MNGDEVRELVKEAGERDNLAVVVADILADLADEEEAVAQHCLAVNDSLIKRIAALENDAKVHWVRLVDLKSSIERLERTACIKGVDHD